MVRAFGEMGPEKETVKKQWITSSPDGNDKTVVFFSFQLFRLYFRFRRQLPMTTKIKRKSRKLKNNVFYRFRRELSGLLMTARAAGQVCHQSIEDWTSKACKRALSVVPRARS